MYRAYTGMIVVIFYFFNFSIYLSIIYAKFPYLFLYESPSEK
jgi:hypothetical protein